MSTHETFESLWEKSPQICQKFKMAAKVAKIGIFQMHIEYTTMRVKISVEMALSLTVSEILTFFVFLQKFKMAAKSGEN